MAYDEITRDRQNMAIITRSAAQGELTSIYANSQVYHGSFSLITIRDTRGSI